MMDYCYKFFKQRCENLRWSLLLYISYSVLENDGMVIKTFMVIIYFFILNILVLPYTVYELNKMFQINNRKRDDIDE